MGLRGGNRLITLSLWGVWSCAVGVACVVLAALVSLLYYALFSPLGILGVVAAPFAAGFTTCIVSRRCGPGDAALGVLLLWLASSLVLLAVLPGHALPAPGRIGGVARGAAFIVALVLLGVNAVGSAVAAYLGGVAGRALRG